MFLFYVIQKVTDNNRQLFYYWMGPHWCHYGGKHLGKGQDNEASMSSTTACWNWLEFPFNTISSITLQWSAPCTSSVCDIDWLEEMVKMIWCWQLLQCLLLNYHNRIPWLLHLNPASFCTAYDKNDAICIGEENIKPSGDQLTYDYYKMQIQVNIVYPFFIGLFFLSETVCGSLENSLSKDNFRLPHSSFPKPNNDSHNIQQLLWISFLNIWLTLYVCSYHWFNSCLSTSCVVSNQHRLRLVVAPVISEWGKL